jgi:acetyltransferase-like isoleucine patch superfamily enzyme
MNTFLKVYRICKRSESNFLFVLLMSLYYKVKKKNIIAHPKVRIRGIQNLHTGGLLRIGTNNAGFNTNSDVTQLRINGQLRFLGNFCIGRGCRFDVGKQAVITIGRNGKVNSNTLFIIMHELKIGNECNISWNCQFLDDYFHRIHYEDDFGEDVEKIDTEKRATNGSAYMNSNGIYIGDHVWIGCNTKIYKGSFIGDGCVVASDSVVKGRFEEKNVLIAGNPARVVKRNISWS